MHVTPGAGGSESVGVRVHACLCVLLARVSNGSTANVLLLEPEKGRKA